ncbi:MarR family winged helix-turn-helix transcriptional regulator [Cytobacillus sp. Hz8]|uniref:MarR family winged helix-turn-helix transcriptional regulator n=1 Tax=Cytobacillus sp. Hz8 TaxID=3347168 RepID=UPI0035D883E7
MKEPLQLEKQLCFAVYETASEFNKLYTSVLQPFGLTYPQYLVLLALWEQDGLTSKELGEKVNLGTGTLTPMITRMEANGWLQKMRAKEDERKVYIFLQEKAENEKAAIVEKVSEKIRSCQIELEEYQILMANLKSLRGKLRKR